MKPMTIWQRLDRALLLLILLLFVAVGLAFWVALERSNASQRSDQLSGDRDRVYYDVMLMIDSLRGLSVEPRNETELRRHRDAANELEDNLDKILKGFKDFPDLVTAVKNLNEFARGTAESSLGDFHKRVLAIAESDVAGAQTYFNNNYPPL